VLASRAAPVFARLGNHWVDAVCCTLGFSLALAIGVAATGSGPGLTPDSAMYISVARNLCNGHGFVTDIVGPLDQMPVAPMTALAPGYSIFIAALIKMGLPAIEAARFVSLLSFAALGITAYWLGYMLQGRPCAILSCATTLILPATVRLATFALSDMTFAALSALNLGAMVMYVNARRQQRRWLLFSAFFIALATLVRYYGIVWVLAGIPIILLSRKLTLKQRIVWSASFSILSLVPIVPWFIRNGLITGQFSGIDRERGYHLDVLGNIQVALKTLDADLLIHFNVGVRTAMTALYHISLIPLIFFVVAAGCAVLAWRSGFLLFILASVRRLQSRRALSVHAAMISTLILNVFIYVCGLVILASNILFLPSDWPRYIAPIYPILGLVWVDIFLGAVSRIAQNYPRRAVMTLGLLAGLVLWVLPYSIETKYLVDQTSLGLSWTFTAEKWRSNEGLTYLRHIISRQDIVYSDSATAVSVLLGRPARQVPVSNDAAQIAAWLDRPKVSGVNQYVIVFKKNLAGHPPPDEPPYWPLPVLDADMLRLEASRSDVHLLADFSDAAIYRLGN
jgi:4-amino-4-deoxy-L-arabinose transferase-like glycosyltransferase